MTRILNFIAHIGGYAGAGMVILIIGIILIIIAIIRLSGLRKAERSRSVAEFNQRFAADTGTRISDVEAGRIRQEMADRLRIGERRE